jgi:hypothetical protein
VTDGTLGQPTCFANDHHSALALVAETLSPRTCSIARTRTHPFDSIHHKHEDFGLAIPLGIRIAFFRLEPDTQA